MKNSVCLKRMLVILVFGCQALFAQPVTFYFFPPDNDIWVAGNSYIYDGDKKTVSLMNVDTKCGWFKKVFAKDSIPDKVLIYLGSQGRDIIDLNGTRADTTDPAWIRLKNRFGDSTSLYFYQDARSDDPGFTFSFREPNMTEDKNRCSYKMAAFIYDTDNSVNKSFSGTYTQLPAGQRSIQRGIVASTLNPETKKPTFIAANGRSNWVNEESFNAAFTPEGKIGTTISNIARCYDMPFGRATNGTWEFDSDKMLTPDGRYLVGGYFPYILDSAYNDDGSREDYASKCPTCNKKYSVACFQNPSTTMNNMTLAYKGETYTGRDAFDRWYFAEGAELGAYYGNAPNGCAVRPGPGNGGTTTNRANLSFCFESHAEFTYEKGQEFFFRGDDDIWIFINNRLVIDLGGVHSAAPGYVDLDSIGDGGVAEKLVAGKTYPIDIFFCERMANQSNVRVSTNMYITQKSTFSSDPKGEDNAMCAAITSGNDCASKMSGAGSSKREEFCGPELLGSKDGKYTVDFYMINRATNDTIYLSPPPAGSKAPRGDCQGTATNFTCYAKDGIGITVKDAVYSCGERYQCKGSDRAQSKINIPQGSFTVYARLMENGKPTPNRPLNIDNLKSPTNARIVWGELNGEDALDAYGNQTQMRQSIIAGKRTPIYVAVGNWTDKYIRFEYQELEASDRKPYSLSGADELDIYLDSTGDARPSFPRIIPQTGIDTLWVRGGFGMGDQKLKINLSGLPDSGETPALELNIYQPRLRFVRTDSTTNFVDPINYNASGYQYPFLRWTDSELPPYVNKLLDVYVVAWDSLKRVICGHCTFPLKQTSNTNSVTIDNKFPDGVVQTFDAPKIVNGRQTIYIKGLGVVEGSNYAEWKITGPSEDVTFAKWDSLQFRDAPIPMPLESFIVDRNGDGIADSISIRFSKSFKNEKGIVDSLLPVLLEVTWQQGNPVAFKLPDSDYTVEKLKDSAFVKSVYNKTFFEKNRKYWENYIKGDSLIVIADSNTAFSNKVVTSGYNLGSGKISSYTPFYDQGKCMAGDCPPSAFMWRKEGYEASVTDRVSPIVERAVYIDKGKKDCGKNKGDACEEWLEITLSEPIFAAPKANDNNLLIKNPFSYCFEYSQNSKCSAEGKGVSDSERRSQKYDNSTTWKWELPQNKQNGEDTSDYIKYRPNNKIYPKEYYDGASPPSGDNMIDLIYFSYKTENGTTRMPKATDWIKIRWPYGSKKVGIDGTDVFYDAAGNTANPREIGVLISGTNRYNKEQVKISVIDKGATPDDPFFSRDKYDIQKCNIKGKPCADWISPESKNWANDNLFKDTSIAEFLPIPKGMNSDDAKANFPGSVGAIFDIADNINNEASKIVQDCGSSCKIVTKDGRELPLTPENIAEGISFRASVYYHTNLGNYTAHRNPVISYCTDRIFKKKDVLEDNNNCYSNRYNYYLAWDLKTNKNRFVGTGAYVAITKFYWQIQYIDAQGNPITLKYGKNNGRPDEFVELYGVHRSK